MIQEPYKIYGANQRIGATGTIGQWLTWPATGSVIVYTSYGPTAQALGGYTAGNGTGTIGQVVNLLTDANGGGWYEVDTTSGDLPASVSWPGSSNTVYIPQFGDTSNPDYTNLNAIQTASSGQQTSFTASPPSTSTTPGTSTPGNGGTGTTANGGTGGANILPFGEGTGNISSFEKSFLVGALLLLGGIIVVNQATK